MRRRGNVLLAGVFVFMMMTGWSSLGWADTLVSCVGKGDGPALQAALTTGGRVRVEGLCDVASGLTAPTARTVLTGPASITLQGGPLTITGSTVTIEDVLLWTPGIGVIAGPGTRIARSQINSRSHGVVAAGGAGLWLQSVHLNGTPNAGSVGIILGWNVAGGLPGWDSAWISDTIIEEHDGGLRLGGPSASVCNVWLSGLVIDRVKWIGLHVEPWGTGMVCNVQGVNLWMAGRNDQGLAPILLNATRTTRPVATLLLSQGYFSGFQRRTLWVVGRVENVVTSALVWGGPGVSGSLHQAPNR